MASITDTPLCALAFANQINSGDTDWDAQSDTQKQTAIDWASIYLRANYRFTGFDPLGAISQVPEAVQIACAMLALEQRTKNIFERQTVDRAREEGKTIKAGSVTIQKKYNAELSGTFIDPFPAITGLLARYATLSPQNSNTKFVRRA